ncbi:MAG: hypothetical protein RL660_1981 [Bacteroidota bacterium]|jgi:hypothetical protein
MNIKRLVSICVAMLGIATQLNAQQQKLTKDDYTISNAVNCDVKGRFYPMPIKTLKYGQTTRVINENLHYSMGFRFYGIFFTYGPKIKYSTYQYFDYNAQNNELGEPTHIDFDLPVKRLELSTIGFHGDTILLTGTTPPKKKAKTTDVIASYYLMSNKASGYTKLFTCPKGYNVRSHFEPSTGNILVIAYDTKSKASTKAKYAIYDAQFKPITQPKALTLAGVRPEDIARTIALNNKLYFEKRVQTGKGGFLKSPTYKMQLYTIEDGKLKTVNLNMPQASGRQGVIYRDYVSNVVRYVSMYGPPKKPSLGIAIGNITDDGIDTSSIKYCPFKSLEFDGSSAPEQTSTPPPAPAKPSKASKSKSKQTSKSSSKSFAEKNKERIAKRKKEDAQGVDKITNCSLNENGELLVTAENYQVITRTSTTRTPTGTGTAMVRTETRTYYQYGPGVLYKFDKQNNLESYEGLDYRFTAQYDLGYGIQPEISNTGKAIFSVNGEFYKVKLRNKLSETNNAYKMVLIPRRSKDASLVGKYHSPLVMSGDKAIIFNFDKSGKMAAIVIDMY